MGQWMVIPSNDDLSFKWLWRDSGKQSVKELIHSLPTRQSMKAGICFTLNHIKDDISSKRHHVCMIFSKYILDDCCLKVKTKRQELYGWSTVQSVEWHSTCKAQDL